MWFISLFTAAASLKACAALHQHAWPAVHTGPVRLTLENVDDMTFTASVPVSGEEVHPIMDTGSFELVLFEHNCFECPRDNTYFNRDKAGKDFQDMGIDSQQSYGSGTVYGTAVQSGVSLKGLQASEQIFWLGYDVKLNVDLDDTFGGIFGLGPPASALAFATASLKASEDWVEGLSDSEQGQYQDMLEDMRQVVNLSKSEKPWLVNVGVSKFSICLLPGTGKSGALVLNDAVPDSGSWVKVHGDFWQVHLSKASIGKSKTSACTAIVDSGTSLIGAPSDFISKVETLVENLIATYGCQDLSDWPSFELNLKGGQVLTLDPSSYVAEFDMYTKLTEQDDSTAEAAMKRVKELMPHLDRATQRQLKSGATGTICAPSMFSMDMDPGESDDCQFLFGLPIFREYYISHKIKEDGSSEAMLFSKGDSDCKFMNQSEMLVERKSVVPYKVDPRKIRFPSLILNGHRAQSNLSRGRK